MNADQLAEIRPALREVFDGAPNTCATFEIDGDPTTWIQIVGRTLNAAYPYTDGPEERMTKLGLQSFGAKRISWEGGKFATFEFAQFDVNAVAHWIDAYLVGAIGCPVGAYHLDVTFEKI